MYLGNVNMPLTYFSLKASNLKICLRVEWPGNFYISYLLLSICTKITVEPHPGKRFGFKPSRRTRSPRAKTLTQKTVSDMLRYFHYVPIKSP